MFITRPELDVEGLSVPAGFPRGRSSARGSPIFRRLREQATTTPGRLTLIAILVIAGAVCFGVIATVAERVRAQAAQAARAQTEPLLVQASALYTALADANATVTTALLSGGLEPPVKRARYEHDLRAASDALATLTREAGTSPSARLALGTVTEQLPVYSGLVEAARANNRQGFPVGAAYLRQASSLLTSVVLPAANRLYSNEARRLSEDYASGTAAAALAAFAAAVVVAFVLLLIAHRYLARISRRIFNLPMLASSCVLLAASIWGLVGLLSEQSALASARRSGSDSVEVLSGTRVLLSRAQGDQSLTLVNRGTDVIDPLDFRAVMRALAPGIGDRGLIGLVPAVSRRIGSGPLATELTSEFVHYRTQAGAISALEANGQIDAAIRLEPAAAAISDQMSANLEDQTRAAQRRFARSAAEATSAVYGLWLAIPLMTLLALALALLGLRQRMSEYR